MESNRRANAVLDGQGAIRMIGRLFRLLILLAVLAAVGLIGYSYSGFMTPETRDISEPASLDGE